MPAKRKPIRSNTANSIFHSTGKLKIFPFTAALISGCCNAGFLFPILVINCIIVISYNFYRCKITTLQPAGIE